MARTSGRVTAPAALALAGIGLYVVLDVVAQLLPPHFDPITQVESDLGAGEFGWVMSVAFVVRGLVGAATIVTVRRATPASARRTVGSALLAGWSVCSALLAFFPTDITDAATRAGDTGPTFHGLVHLVLAAIAFACAAAGCIVLAGVVRFPAALVIGIAAAVCLLLLPVAARLHVVGLVERLFIALVLLWQALAVSWVGRGSADGGTDDRDRRNAIGAGGSS